MASRQIGRNPLAKCEPNRSRKLASPPRAISRYDGSRRTRLPCGAFLGDFSGQKAGEVRDNPPRSRGVDLIPFRGIRDCWYILAVIPSWRPHGAITWSGQGRIACLRLAIRPNAPRKESLAWRNMANAPDRHSGGLIPLRVRTPSPAPPFRPRFIRFPYMRDKHFSLLRRSFRYVGAV